MNKLIPLSSWLLAEAGDPLVVSDSSALVAEINRTALVAKVAAWYRLLEPLPCGRWALYHADPVEFLAALLALWQLQRTVCVPGDNRSGTVERLRGHVVGFAGEFPGGVISDPENASEADCASPYWRQLSPDFEALEVFTSGSSGEPKAIPKALFQLEQEIQALEQLWPSDAGAIVLATVSHHHIYGLLFRILWPLCTGRAFERALCHYPEDILERASHYRRFTMVTSPAHLNRFSAALDWQPLQASLVSLYSSAAPLSREVSLSVRSLLGQGVREIYGSSETGGIAWRVQDRRADADWMPLPGVTLRQDDVGTTWIRSCHLPAPGEQEAPDLIEQLEGGRFRLLGRVDRVAKIEGKRVALNALEQQLCALPWVISARCLPLTRRRVEVVAVIEPSAQGRALLEQQGKRALIQRLRDPLSAHFETVVLPRRWRFVEQFPYNEQGKLTLESLELLFEKERVEQPGDSSLTSPSMPRVIRQSQDETCVQLELEVPADLIYFDGHFAPDKPILPGVVQVHWAEALGRDLFALTGDFLRLEAIKFQQVVRPGQRIKLELKHLADKGKLVFSYTSAEAVHSSGRICFGAADV